jgi:hypothetical protein
MRNEANHVSSPDASHSDKRGRGGFATSLVVIVLLILYPVSYGPVMGVLGRFASDPVFDAGMKVYLPLHYVSWWIGPPTGQWLTGWQTYWFHVADRLAP